MTHYLKTGLESMKKIKAKCIVCAKTIMLSSAGRSALTDHSKGKKHMEALNKRNTFFAPNSKNKGKSDIESGIVSNKLCLIVSQQRNNLS